MSAAGGPHGEVSSPPDPGRREGAAGRSLGRREMLRRVGGNKELADMRAYLALVAREARLRFDAGIRPGQAAAEIDVGRYVAWTKPGRTLWNTVRLYADFTGTLTPARELAAQNRAVAEYAAIRPGRAA